MIKAVATADDEVSLARRAVEAADEDVETAKADAARHLTDVARGTAGVPPQTIREARAAAIEAADHLDACLVAREALKAEKAGDNGISALLVRMPRAVIRAEVAASGVAMAAGWRNCNASSWLIAGVGMVGQGGCASPGRAR